MFSTKRGWHLLAGGLAAHRICLQRILKHGIMTKEIADRKRLGSCLEFWKEVQREMSTLDRGPPTAYLGKSDQRNCHMERVFELDLER